MDNIELELARQTAQTMRDTLCFGALCAAIGALLTFVVMA